MRTGLAAAIFLMLMGCASSGPRIDASRLAELHKGKSTAAQIVGEFGRPTILSRNMDGTQTATYLFKDGGSGAAGFVPVVGALAGADANVDSVIFYFDAKGILTDYKTTQASAAGKAAPAEPVRGAQSAPVAPATPAAPAVAGASPAAQTGDAKAPEAQSGSRTKLNLPSLLPSATRDPRAPD